MSPSTGSINIFVTTQQAAGSSSAADGTGTTTGGGGRRGGGRAPGQSGQGKTPSGSPNNPVFIQGAVSFVRLFSPLLALYAIDRTLRAMGLTSTVLNSWIRALGAVWSAIADTMLLPLMPIFMKMLDVSLKALNWMQQNWPRIVKNVGDWIGGAGDKFKRGDWLGGAGDLVGGFFKLRTDEKITVLISTLLATIVALNTLKFAIMLLGGGKTIGAAGAGLGGLGRVATAGAVGGGIGAGLVGAALVPSLIANAPFRQNPFYHPGERMGIYGANAPGLFRPGALFGDRGQSGGNTINNNVNTTVNVNLAQADRLETAAEEARKSIQKSIFNDQKLQSMADVYRGGYQ